MKDFSQAYPNREFDELYYADDERMTVDRVQAFKCPPNDDDVRWVPEKGYSTTIGHTLQRTAEAARAQLRKKLTVEREGLKARMAAIDSLLAK